MNIFALDEDTTLAAQYHCNRHVVKMIVEYAQILSTAHRILDGKQVISQSKTGRRSAIWVLQGERDQLYKATHINHPSSVWARISTENYRWLHSLLVAVSKEYTYRYGREHKCSSDGLIDMLEDEPDNVPSGILTPVILAMSDEYKLSCHVESYRNYYRLGKKHLHDWVGRVGSREVPGWI